MSLQNIGQSMAPASHAVILLSLESVFGVLFSCLLLGEKVTLQMGVGFAISRAAGQRTCAGEKRLTREYVVGS